MTVFALDISPQLMLLMSSMLVMAVWRDLRFSRIDNWITFPGAFLAIGMHIYLAGWSGASFALFGLLLGLMLLMPFYVLGGMAAGDVKLMAALGACIGAPAIFWTTLYTLVAGAVLALLLMAMKRELGVGLGHMGRQMMAYTYTRVWVPASSITAKADLTISQRFPYAAAIAGGCLAFIFWGSPSGV